LDSLIKSIEKRVKACIKAEGWYKVLLLEYYSIYRTRFDTSVIAGELEGNRRDCNTMEK
jgi:hypothetical protein